MHIAEVLEFPFVEELPKREKSKLVKIWDQFKALSDAQKEHGILLPAVFVASMLGVSRQRVHTLGQEGRLKVIRIGGQPFITEESTIEYARSERKSGRPPNIPNNTREIFQRSMDAAKGRVK